MSKSLVRPDEFRQGLAETFTLEELNDVCFAAKIEYENVRGNTLNEKARELIRLAVREDRLDDLLKYLKSKRHKVNWAYLAEREADAPAQTESEPPVVPPQTFAQSFNPVGRWQLAVPGNPMYSDQVQLLPNGTFSSNTLISGMSLMNQGTWAFYPQNNLLQVQGYSTSLYGTQPFVMQHTFRQGNGSQFMSLGGDGINYLWTRLA